MKDNSFTQTAKGVIATVGAVALAIIPFVVPADDAAKITEATIAIAAALGVVLVPNAPTRRQYQRVARDVLGTSLVKATTTNTGHLNVVTTDDIPATVTVTNDPNQRPIVTRPIRGVAPLKTTNTSSDTASGDDTTTSTPDTDPVS